MSEQHCAEWRLTYSLYICFCKAKIVSYSFFYRHTWLIHWISRRKCVLSVEINKIILNHHTMLKKTLSQKCNQNICSFRKFYSQSKTLRYSHPCLVLNFTERKHLIFKSILHFYSWDNYTYHILIIKHLTMFIAIRNYYN